MINDSLQSYLCGRYIEPREYVEKEPETLVSMKEAAALAKMKICTFSNYRKSVPEQYAIKGLTRLPKGIKKKGSSGHIEIFLLKHQVEEWVKQYKRIKNQWH